MVSRSLCQRRLITEDERVKISTGDAAAIELVCKLGLMPKLFKHHSNLVLMALRTSAIDRSVEAHYQILGFQKSHQCFPALDHQMNLLGRLALVCLLWEYIEMNLATVAWILLEKMEVLTH